MQLRTIFIASVIGLLLASAVGLANAQQIYKWKDAQGVTHFSQTPPTNGAHYTKMHLDQAPEVSSNPPPAPAAANNAEPGNNAAPRTAAAGGTQADTPTNREKLCQQLGSNITLLQGKQPVVTGGGSGKQQVMSDSTRAQQLATARAQQAQYCSGH